MRSITRTAFGMVFLALTLRGGVASAQESIADSRNEPGTLSPASGSATAPGGIAAAVRRAAISPAAPAGLHGGQKGTLIGVIAGAAGAASVTYWAANEYGRNESGRFCTACFMSWGAFSIPAGALVGGLVGNLVDRAFPQSAPRVPHSVVTPVIGRRGGGVVVSVRY